MPSNLQTPGVYISEINAFTTSVDPVATAIPAFIGYTPRAWYNGKDCTGVPVLISSLAEFLFYFAITASDGTPLPSGQQYTPVFYPVPAANPAKPDVTLNGQPYDLQPEAGTLYYLYSSLQLFYQNGGGPCYVVSVGPYGSLRQGAGGPGATPVVNPNVQLAPLTAALAAVAAVPEVTLIVIPDAILLGAADNASLNLQVLAQCGQLGSRVALFDLRGGDRPDPVTWFADDITPFRAAIGAQNLSYGAAYYPFLVSSVTAPPDITFNNIGGGAATLRQILTGGTTDPALVKWIAAIGQSGPGAPSPAQIETCLLAASSDYRALNQAIVAKTNILPPSGAMAGVLNQVDQTRGVWNAPANVGLNSVTDVTLRLDDGSQDSLKVDATSGKSINALRVFPVRGVMVWGARTLDGNSTDWRYINVRRTMIMIEQSISLALQACVFQANDAQTWAKVTSMLSGFLTNLWAQGALVGAKAADSFSVSCGLGSTMTATDILNGVMNVSVNVAVTDPGEFLEINLSQTMPTAGSTA